MHKRSASNYSLWPEQSRPRRGKGLTLAASGFAIGIACAIAANSVISDVINPPADPDAARPVAVEDHAPIYATPVFSPAIIPPLPAKEASTTGVAVTPTPAPAGLSPTASVTPIPRKPPEDAQKVAKPSRTAARAPSELARPANGAYAAGPSAATDGRGGDGIIEPTTLGALNPVLGTRLSDEEEPSARDGTTREGASRSERTKPAATSTPRRTREQATRTNRKKRRSSYAVRHRTGPVYGTRGQVMSGGGGADY